jgi:hypothetical protein
MVVDEAKLGHLAGLAMAQGMYPYTFGIVGDGIHGDQGKSLGTGIGVQWGSTSLILTAAHTLETTPYDRMYFFLPMGSLEFVESAASADPSRTKLQYRNELVSPKVVLDETGEDIAAVLLPTQSHETIRDHFYPLVENQVLPAVVSEVGYLGYPGVRALPYGKNYMVSPYHDFGNVAVGGTNHNTRKEILIEYRPAEIDPHGLSGSGVWYSQSAGAVWAPRVALAGLLTQYDSSERMLIAYRVEALVEFLKVHRF